MSVDWKKMKERRKSKDMVSGIPKPTLKFGDLLERLTRPRKAAILVVMAYYSKRTQNEISIDVSKGKRHIGWVLEESRQQSF